MDRMIYGLHDLSFSCGFSLLTIFAIVFGYVWMVYEFHDLGGFKSRCTMHCFLSFGGLWVSRKGLVLLEKIAILVWFFAFNCFGCFCVTDAWFVDYMILGNQ